MLGLGTTLFYQMKKVKDILFGNIHTEAAENLTQENGGYLLWE